MSEPIDDKVFDEYLSRQSQLSKRYRALGADEVPPDLDRRVLAQAHEAVAGKSARSDKRPAWMRWSAPLALAASAVLVVSIIIESGTQHEVTPRAVLPVAPQDSSTSGTVAASRDLSTRENASPQAPQQTQETQALQLLVPAAVNDSGRLEAPPAPAPKKAAASPASSVAQAAMESLIVPIVPVTPPPPELMADLPAEASPTTAIRSTTAVTTASTEMEKRADRDVTTDKSFNVEETIITGSRRHRPTAGQGAGPRSTVPPVAASDTEESDAASAQLEREGDPQSWLEFIRQLRKDGKSRQAAREWKHFRAAYPEYPVDERDAARTPK